MSATYTLQDGVEAPQAAFRAQPGLMAAARTADACLRRALRTPGFLEASPAFDSSATNMTLYKDSEFGFLSFGDPRFTGLMGGVMVKDGDRVIGGVGVSGQTGGEDFEVAQHALAQRAANHQASR